MGTSRLAEFPVDPWPLSLEGLLKKYVSRYGLEAVSLRFLHPDHLVNGNLVDDFLAAIDLPGFPALGPVSMLNRSLTQHGAQVADIVAELAPRGLRKGARRQLFQRLLQAIAGPRFVLPQEVQARIIVASQGDVAYVRRHWGLELRAELVEPQDAPDLEEEAVLTLALALVEQVKRAVEVEEGPTDDDGT